MNYPGNASLSQPVKDRVVSTFQQAVTLYRSGRMDEVSAGCNLILQMDPTFDPARKLLDKIRNPSLPIDVDSLLPDSGGDAMKQAREAMAERDFQRAIHLTTEILTEDLLNDEARILGDEAREKLEAAPFVEQFTRKVTQHLASGNIAAAKMDYEKARSLDEAHPEVIRIGREITARESAPPVATPVPSFVVEDRPATGRGAAQASDFGFTFEEEKAPAQFTDFSFGAPAAATPESPFGGFNFGATPGPAGGAEFDFATASVATSSEDQKKIEQYLADGDRAEAGGDLQQAIDIWSRIFLIDVTNEQASERIERARIKRRETEQQIDPMIVSGIEAFDRGDVAAARSSFSEVLRIDPGNAVAQDYLDRLKEGVPPPAAAPVMPPTFEPSAPSDEKIDLDFFEEEPAAGETPLIPPPPGSAARPAASAKSKPAPKSGSGTKPPLAMIAAAVGLIVLLAGGWFVWSKFFNEPENDPAATQAIFSRAASLASAGKYDQAIALLQDVQPGDPERDKALEMIADLQQKKATSAQLIDGMPAEQYFSQRIAAARTAHDAHDYTAAKAAFEQAMRVKPLPPDLKAQYDETAQQVAKLDAAKALFSERKYAEAITNLQPLLDQDPQNQSIRRMIVDAHFNLGAVALQEERTQDAIREFDEVLKVTPDDEFAKRSRELALRYDDAPRDLLYRIYVKYLPLRQAS